MKTTSAYKTNLPGFSMMEICVSLILLTIVIGFTMNHLGDKTELIKTAKPATQKTNLAGIQSAVAMAANRAVISSDTNIAGTPMTFEGLQPYLRINGSKPQTPEDMAKGTGVDAHAEFAESFASGLRKLGINPVYPSP